MESSRPVAFFALDVASPPPLIVPLSATDIIVPRMTTAWSSEPLPRDLQLLANTLRRIKAARFKPYLADVPHSRSSSPSSASSHSPSPSPPPQRVDKGKGQQTPVLPLRPPSVQPLDQGDEDSDTETGGGGGEEDEEELQDECIFHQPSRATVERILIPQPKGIRSLGLKQLGVELNWSNDTYEHIVHRNMLKNFPQVSAKRRMLEDSSCKNLLSEESPAAWKAFKHEASSNRASTSHIVMRKGGTYVHNHYHSGEDMGETLIDTALQNTSSIFSAGPSVSSRCQTQQDGLAVNGITPGPNAASLAVVKPVKGERDIIFLSEHPKGTQTPSMVHVAIRLSENGYFMHGESCERRVSWCAVSDICPFDGLINGFDYRTWCEGHQDGGQRESDDDDKRYDMGQSSGIDRCHNQCVPLAGKTISFLLSSTQ
ncbi:hypothetical protein IW262DRAFT_1295906 [Armillaria fumosa]|nr:hypothetical protein IW262DRAFT_1295906 [Armillaria fumosa]